MRLTILTAISLLLGGCSAIVHFDRSRIPDGGVGMDGGGGCDPTTHDGCAADQLCCNGACVNTGLTQCAACGTPCAGSQLCMGRMCAACDPTNNAGCSGTTPICNATTIMCESCQVGGTCPGSLTCQPSGECGCRNDGDCATGAPTTPVCGTGSVCRGCMQGSSECSTIDTSTPICLTSGDCVQCGMNTDCMDAAMPICGSNGVCRACMESDCTGAGQHCATSGAHAGSCQQCDPAMTGQCSGTTPICDSATASCMGCTADGQCMAISASLVCVDATDECRACDPGDDAPCTGTMPICDGSTFTCRACMDADCPGHCMGGVCLQCIMMSECPAPQVCSAAGRCVDCDGTGQQQCPDVGFDCQSNQCICMTPGGGNNNCTCDTGPDCMAGRRCNVVTDTCVVP